MKTSELIQRIQSLYSKGVESDDTRLSSRHIYSKISTVRNVLISQKAKKRHKISQWNYQSIDCLELVKATYHECNCIPPIGCSILKSKYPIPKIITNYNKHLIQDVSSLNGEITYSEIPYQRKKYKTGDKYTSQKPDFFIKNDYLFITHKKGPKIISLTAIFQNPEEVLTYPSYCEEECLENECQECKSILDIDFPIDNELIDPLVEMCYKELIEMFNSNIEDSSNNTKDNINQTTK